MKAGGGKYFLGLVLTMVLLSATIALGGETPDPTSKAAFQLRDIYRVNWISGVDISPDGKYVVVTRTTSDLEHNSRQRHLWRIDADGTNPVALTSSDDKNWGAQWSPDGSRIAFLSTRSGAPNVFLMNPDGSDVKQVTKFSLGVSGFVWSPTGTLIAVDTTIYPECGIDDACNALTDELRTQGPLQAHVADELLYRHWDDWRDGRRTALILVDLESGAATQVDAGPFDAPAYNLSGPDGYAFSPDGKELCFTSNHDPDPALSTNTDLFLVPVAGGEAKNITSSNDGWDGKPAYSPDGRTIAYLTQKTPRYESDRFTIALYDRETGTSRVVSDAFDNWVDDIAWTDDGRAILFTGEYHGRNPLYRLDLASGKILPLATRGAIDAFDLAPRTGWVAIVSRTVGEPQEVYRLNLRKGKKLRKTVRLSHFNDALADEVDLRPAE